MIEPAGDKLLAVSGKSGGNVGMVRVSFSIRVSDPGANAGVYIPGGKHKVRDSES